MAKVRIDEKWLARTAANELDARPANLPAGAARLRYWDDTLPGFGVVIGASTATFIARGRVGGVRRDVTIGRWGRVGAGDDKGATWTVERARKRARELLGQMSQKIDPVAVQHASTGGITMREALGLHLDRMRADESSERSITTMESEVEKYLEAWLDRPLASIGRTECRARHEAITEGNGPYIANRSMRHVRALWNTALKEHDLPANPTIAVHWNKEHRRQEPITWAALPAWHAAVMALGEKRENDRGQVRFGSPIRRDYNLLVLLTGLRRMDAATIRWEHVDLDGATLHRPNPKGGRERAFSIPLSAACVEILKRRRDENKIAFTSGDGGWAFPTTALLDRECPLCEALGLGDHEAGEVTHLAEPKEDDERLVSPHRLRDTYTTALAALDPPVSGFVIDVLTNHRPPRGTVTAGYVNLTTDDVRSAQDRVSAFLLGKITPREVRSRPTTRARRTRRS